MRTCVRCGSKAKPEYNFRKATPEQRETWREAGIRPLRGRGLCRSCHLIVERDGTLIDYETRIVPGDVIAEEWHHFADPSRPIRQEAKRLAGRFGMNWSALERAVNRAGIRAAA